MLILYHSPHSRSTRILDLIYAMGIADRVTIRIVSIPRQDGSGGRDPLNPHPEGKVPLLIHDGVEIWESAAIMLYLADLFPAAEYTVPAGDPERGRFLSWMTWYAGVMEPVILHAYAGIDHPLLHATYRGMPELTDRLCRALERGPWLMGDRLTAADILCASPFFWFKESTPDDPLIHDWLARLADLPWQATVMELENWHMAAA
ncbi:glutathione S-transferase family protein [Hyphomonas sp. WL0036]|uniref:glutathione S-transferase family protein n=1 Tax=Hyphomonas sediminis TaxID=2866160 RepID=UPI001C7FFAD7|nr:glutathione S-transferase family protein [Hyphomonas sediminis]MBY9067922.1 glutathione S-transferase family protein [Hyphomonas sediminis]